jgi:glycolate oxidase FAD binding subunit
LRRRRFSGITVSNQQAQIQQLGAIVGSEQVWVHSSLDDRLMRTIYPNEQLPIVVYPQTSEELAEVMACAHLQRWRVLPTGQSSKIHWGGLVKEIDVVVSTARLNRLIEHAVGDLTVTVEAGMRLAELQATLAQAGQFLALDPAYPDSATLGGIVATADAGSLRHRYGGVRDMLLGLSFVRYDGQIAKAGGRVVKNVAGYDLMKLMTGSYGTLGILTQLTFRVYPLPETSQTVVLKGTPATIAQAAQTLLSSALTPHALDLISPQLSHHLDLGTEMSLLVQFQGILASVKEQVNRVLEVAQALGLVSLLYTHSEEASLWQALQQQMEPDLASEAIVGKIGLQSSTAISAIDEIDHSINRSIISLVHLGSGIGKVYLPPGSTVKDLLQVRKICESNNGYMTVLQAPTMIKQTVDVWGYTGNALDLMQTLKQHFDPQNLLSPHRFVTGI